MRPIYRLWPAATQYPIDNSALLDLYPSPDGGTSWLRINAVSSLDGAAAVEGRSTALSSPGDKRVFGLLRAQCDALLVGAGTARDEGYGPLDLGEHRRAMRRAWGIPEHPTLVVVSGGLSLEPDHPMFAQAPTRPIVLTSSRAPADRRAAFERVADVVVTGEKAVDLRASTGLLRARGLHHVLCEGGPTLLGSLVAEDLVDELCLTVSPLLAGAGPIRLSSGNLVPPEPRRLVLRHVLAAGDALLMRHTRPEPPRSP